MSSQENPRFPAGRPPEKPEPERAAVHPETIPQLLKALDQWVCWRHEVHPSRQKPLKVPYDARTGARASVQAASTWHGFATAWHAYVHQGVYSGVGFVLTPEDPVVGVDIDNCLDPGGQLDEVAQSVVALLDSYTEISPSGTGLRIFVQADLGDFSGRRTPSLELYNFGRYLTVTGHHLAGTPGEPAARLSQLRHLYRKFFLPQTKTSSPTKPADSSPSPPRPAAVEEPDEQVLGRMFAGKLGHLYRQIYEGDVSAVYGYDGDGGPDQSRADVLLFNALAFYTYGDAQQMRRILLSSPRAAQRMAKWNKRVRGEITYLEYQIADSIAYTRKRR